MRTKSSPSRRSSPATLKAVRDFYARYITAAVGVTDEGIIHAFATVPRENFLGAGPWHVHVSIASPGHYLLTGTDDPVVLYQNILIGLVPLRGINNGQPTLHAKLIATAAPRVGDVVIHVGAGTGYYTAVLAQLVGPGGKIEAYEVDAELAARAETSLAHLPHVHVRAQSALEAALPVANIIYVSAGATHIPTVFLDALAIGGRLILPLAPNERFGYMVLVTRISTTTFGARLFMPAAFIACVGARDEAHSKILAAALDAGGADKVRSLHRGTTADASAWCVCAGYWLSTNEPMSL